MKKRLYIALSIVLIVLLGVGIWFYGYYNRKSNDNLPSLSFIAEMNESEVNELLIGYKQIQLIEVWGEPNGIYENENIWNLTEVSRLQVKLDEKGIVIDCSFLAGNCDH